MNNVPILPLSQANIPIMKTWCCTEMKVHEFSYTWTIKNFSFCREGMGSRIISREFYIGNKHEIKSSLILYPEGNGEGAPDHLSLFLKLVSRKDAQRDVVRADWQACILGKDKSENHSVHFQIGTFSFVNNHTLGWHKFIERKLLANGSDLLLPNDELTILCKGNAAMEFVNDSGEFESIPSTVTDYPVLKDFGSFFDNKNFSDVSLLVNGQEFRAHKVILAAQSPVFAAMFNHEMMEQKQHSVGINDIEHDVFSEMLKFMYTGKAPNLEKMAFGLLSASDKYIISRLKAMCENTLASSIKTENVVDILILADRHRSDELKCQAIKFVAQNIANVKQTMSFKSMTSSHPHLLDEILMHWH